MIANRLAPRDSQGEERRARCAATLLALGLVLLTTAARATVPTLDEARDLHLEGKLDEALAAYRAVGAALARTAPEDAATARNNACVILNDRGEYRAALAECAAALALRRNLGDPPRLARTLNNLGLALQYLGRFAEAERRFREALAINRRTGDAESEAVNLANLGVLATSAGRYAGALAASRAAAAVAARHAREPEAAPWAAEQLRVARINQGVVLEKLGAFREALDLYRAVLAEGEELEPRRRAALGANVGVLYRNLGDPVRAIAEFRAAARIFAREDDRAGLANAWLNLGLVHHLNLRASRPAEEAYREALRWARASGDRTEEIQALFYLGRLLLEEGRLEEAQRALADCLQAALDAGSAEGRWSALEGLGRLAAARGELPEAMEAFARAMDEIERVRSSLERSAWRSSFFGDKRAVYAAAVDVLARQERERPGSGAAGRALEVVERAKVRELLDALGGGPRGAGPRSLPELRRLAGDGLVLEYFAGERHLYLWAIRADGVRMRDLGPARPLLEQAGAVHGALAAGREPEAAALARLSAALLGPAGPLSRGPLSIAPDGRLHYLPFELLPDPGRPGRRLVDTATVSYLPSASALAGLRRGKPAARPRRAFLGFGAPRIPAGGAPTPAGLLVERFRLAALPAAARELAAVAARLPGPREQLTGRAATEAAFRREAARGARVVHLATHTVVDERPGRGAAILLTPAGDDDGLLRPEEVAAVPLNADLAVLASCRTALGPGGGGAEEGGALAGLTGAFLAAGSPAVVATLWDVGDRATAVFMEQLYHQLGRGLAPAEALRAAKRRLSADPAWDRPSLWAAYVLVGDGPPVANRPWAPFGLGGAAVLVLVLGLAARRRRRRG